MGYSPELDPLPYDVDGAIALLAESGIEDGMFNGQPISEWRDLPLVVANTRVDEKASIVLYRKGKRKTIKIQIGKLDDPAQVASTGRPGNAADAYGLQAQDLTPALAEQLGLDDASGVIVTDVEPDGPADEAGIRRGDIIVELDQRTVKNADDLVKKLASSDKSILALVKRGGNTLYVPLKKAG